MTSLVASLSYCDNISSTHDEHMNDSSHLLEVLVEQLGELGDLVLERSGSDPAGRGVEDLVWNTRAGLGDLEVEGLVVLVLDLCELAAVDGVEDGAGVLVEKSVKNSCNSGKLRNFRFFAKSFEFLFDDSVRKG